MFKKIFTVLTLSFVLVGGTFLFNEVIGAAEPVPSCITGPLSFQAVRDTNTFPTAAAPNAQTNGTLFEGQHAADAGMAVSNQRRNLRRADWIGTRWVRNADLRQVTCG